MGKDEMFELPEDPWEELIHQGDVFERSVAATPTIVKALARGTDDDANWLYLLAAMCVGRPERIAKRICGAAREGAPIYRRLLAEDDADVRDAAIGALVASGSVTEDDASRFATMVREDAEPRVRASAALALGLGPAPAGDLADLLDDPDVRHATALALAKGGQADDRVVRVLAEELIDAGERRSPTELPPWDALYPDWASELSSLGETARPAIPLLLEALSNAPSWLAVDLVEAALALAGDDRELRREVVGHVVEVDAPWERASELEYRLRDRGLPESRAGLREWLAG